MTTFVSCCGASSAPSTYGTYKEPPMFDNDCSTYWCPICQREQKIDYRNSSALVITLRCDTLGCTAEPEVFTKMEGAKEVANGQG